MPERSGPKLCLTGSMIRLLMILALMAFSQAGASASPVIPAGFPIELGGEPSLGGDFEDFDSDADTSRSEVAIPYTNRSTARWKSIQTGLPAVLRTICAPPPEI